MTHFTALDTKDSCCSFSGRGVRPTASRWMPLHERARNDDALELVRTFADREQRRVAVIALDVEFPGVAVCAVNAHRFEAVRERGFGSVELGHACLHVAAPAFVVGACG